MSKHDIVVVGSSAGGVYALQELIGGLPADFSGSIFIVQHVSPFAPSMLPEILTRCGKLEARHPYDGEIIRPGQIYIAPPDHHLLVERDSTEWPASENNNVPAIGRILVRKGPKENRFRPSIDALFRSAAYSYGAHVIGVVLTGLLNDGTSGMWTIKRLGGIGIVQRPDDAMYASMPESVLEYVEVDHVLPLADIAPLLTQLTRETVSDTGSHRHHNVPDPTAVNNELNRIKTEVDVAAATQATPFDQGILSMGTLTPLTCPECSGVLVSFQEGHLIRYRCHTGHSYTASTLLVDITKSIEETMWQSVRGLEESVLLLNQAGAQLAEAGMTEAAHKYRIRSEEALRRAHSIRDLIFTNKQMAVDGTLSAVEGV
ncbi:chemotaxis protein CheB [Fibrella forsythiae]|uniref:protein-glutamate methylesterase n=1 Tax=Fibrella forsythiae TaxID=2817061 RepID=A0ABS3JNV0_9BACT|nr:chemotaxis protein CheB [Fibrella forsythiae]MBO0951681.1 chemotaxis protein CheB [Fibrella forsythiae]